MDTLKIVGQVEWWLYDGDWHRKCGAWRVKEHGIWRNVVTNGGLTRIISRLGTAAPADEWVTHVSIGSDGSEAFKADIALGSEFSPITRPAPASAQASNVLTLTATFAAGNGTGTVREWGCFDALTVGILLARTSGFSEFVKTAGDPLDFQWQFTLA